MFTSINQVDTWFLTPREVCIPLRRSILCDANFHGVVVIRKRVFRKLREPTDLPVNQLEFSSTEEAQ